jgi:hypothetical protein
MSDDRARHQLLTRLRQVLGDEEAATLMENLPPHRWSELATKEDLAALEARMASKEDLAALEARIEAKMATKDDLARLEARMDGMATKDALAGLARQVTSLDGDVELLRGEIRHLGESLVLRLDAHESRTEALVRERIDTQTKQLFFSILGALLTTTAIAIGAATVGG